MQRLIRAGVAAGVMSWVSCAAAWAAPLAQADPTDAAPGVWPALLPLILATVGVERAVEVIWNYLEWLLLSVFKWEAVQLKAPQYTQFKSGTSLIFGLILGILLTNIAGLRLFDYLRPLAPGLLVGIPQAWDILITGFLIGSGAKPAHDLIGIINQLKNFLANGAIRQREAAAAALAEGVLKLAQSEAQATVDIPGIGPARMPTPLSSPRNLGDGDEEAVAEKSATERYAELLHRRTIG